MKSTQVLQPNSGKFRHTPAKIKDFAIVGYAATSDSSNYYYDIDATY